MRRLPPTTPPATPLRLLLLLLLAAVATPIAQSATTLPPKRVLSRLEAAEIRARAALHRVSTEARAALTQSVLALRGIGEESSVSAIAANAAMDASAALSQLLVDVRQAVRRTKENAIGPEAEKAAGMCAEETQRRTERALAAAVVALGRCASVASAAEREAARRLAELLEDAERRASEAAAGVGLDKCLTLPRLKASLDCLSRQVQSTRADVLGRADAGVRGARALGSDASQAEQSALGCVERQVEGARVHVASLASWLQGCVASASASAPASPLASTSSLKNTTLLELMSAHI